MKKEVSTIVVLDGGKFLILKRSETSRGSGMWNFPGGGVEENEDIDVAAARELKEEANLDVETQDMVYLGSLTTSYLRIHFFITDKYDGTVLINKESDDFRWVSLDEINDYKFVGGGSLDQELLGEIKKYMENI